jgi:thiol:disulfide interchange protein
VLLPLSLSVLFLVQAAAPASAPAPAPSPAAPAAATIEWKDFGPGLAAAKKDGKPVLVQFFATWCGYCRRMEATTFKNAAVIADLKKAVTVRVDGEEAEARDGFRGADLADKYGVRLFPTHVLIDGEGRVVAKAPGFMEPQAFLSWFKMSLAKAYQQSALPPVPPSGS